MLKSNTDVHTEGRIPSLEATLHADQHLRPLARWFVFKMGFNVFRGLMDSLYLWETTRKLII